MENLPEIFSNFSNAWKIHKNNFPGISTPGNSSRSFFHFFRRLEKLEKIFSGFSSAKKKLQQFFPDFSTTGISGKNLRRFFQASKFPPEIFSSFSNAWKFRHFVDFKRLVNIGSTAQRFYCIKQQKRVFWKIGGSHATKGISLGVRRFPRYKAMFLPIWLVKKTR